MSQNPEHPSKATVEAMNSFTSKHLSAVPLPLKSLCRLEKVSNSFKLGIVDLIEETYEAFNTKFMQKDTTFTTIEEKLDYCSKVIFSRYSALPPSIIHGMQIIRFIETLLKEQKFTVIAYEGPKLPREKRTHILAQFKGTTIRIEITISSER